jgi:ATP-dependent Lhr-like helicase
MGISKDIFSGFHPLIARWFAEQMGPPTDVQEKAWPRISSGKHVLITAPTGSGKTLAAFLWAINQLVTGAWATGRTRVLYVSPLKALNNDIQRNLVRPLVELKQVFEGSDTPFPDIRVLTRSGDTPQSDRRRMQHHPPEILITTPESLNLLLSSPGGRSILRSLSTVILDEIHAVVGNKRGVHLITAVDRLVPLSGEFQRIALSATIRPLETVADFVGGMTIDGDGPHPRYTPRPVTLVCSETTKRFDIRVKFPEEATNRPLQESVWDPLVDEFKTIISRNRSTLLFTNSRRLCEKLTLKINSGEEQPIAYAHHGSLSREIRDVVEQKLKIGELRAIVATNSLELGIDIGALDEVVLIQSPPSISSAIQRVGRAGHQVGQRSHGTLFPTHSHDFLEAAVLAPAIMDLDIEEILPVQCPLDALAQVIVSMVGVETWDTDSLYVQLRASYPYRNLTRDQFHLVLNMLAGRYADSRIRELRPQVSVDRLDNTVAARKGALLALYLSGGTIPDRGYFHLRHHQTNARIGELDEEFVWEASVGQTFALGTQNWKIQQITHNDVFVIPGNPKSMGIPFWIGEENSRDFHFSTRIARFLEFADDKLNTPEFAASLQHENRMEAVVAEQLIEYLKRQKEATNRALPHRHHLLIEFVKTGPGAAPGNQVVLHTFWGGRVNRPFAMALDAAWEDRFGHRLEVYAGNDCVVLVMPHEVTSDELLSLVTSTTVEPLLRKRLETSGFFGARFRECAGRALLLTRHRINQRVPLWMTRLRSQKLLDAVLPYDDFPILLEAWRTCLQDEFDLEGLRQVLTELESGSIRWSEAHTSHPSPMAQGASWRQINQYIYMGDEPASGKTSKLRGDLLHQVVFSPGIRPTVPPHLVAQFELKRKRLCAGYSPSTSRDLIDWVKERLLVPLSEWENLLQAMGQDHGLDLDELLGPVAGKLLRITPQDVSQPLILALETAPRIIHGLYGGVDTVHVESFSSPGSASLPDISEITPAEETPDEIFTSLLGEWLQFYGPTTVPRVRKALGLESHRLQTALEDLIDSQKVITGQLVTGGRENEICDGENFEILLRLLRAGSRPVFESRDIQELALLLATYQGLANREDNVDGLFRRIEQLLCYSAQAHLWESEILPSRLSPYDTSWLDSLMQEGDLRWVGRKSRRVAFCFESDLDLMGEEPNGPGYMGSFSDDPDQRETKTVEEEDDRAGDWLSGLTGRFDFSALLQRSGCPPERLADLIWDAVWAGRVTNDTFLSLRRGIENRFSLSNPTERQARPRSRRRRLPKHGTTPRSDGSLYLAGNWFRVDRPELSDDPLDIEERNKDRVRTLLDRYGILFSELVQRELPPFRWANIFRSLRLMELSGEVLAGCFFHGIPGPQFISPAAFRLLQRKLPEETVFWVNAADPASLCGTQLDSLRGTLPKRVDTTHLVYHGKTLVLVSKRNGNELTFHVSPDDPCLPEYFCSLRHLLMRKSHPLRRITIETINGEKAIHSPYVDAMRTGFDIITDYKNVMLCRRADSL